MRFRHIRERYDGQFLEFHPSSNSSTGHAAFPQPTEIFLHRQSARNSYDCYRDTYADRLRNDKLDQAGPHVWTIENHLVRNFK